MRTRLYHLNLSGYNTVILSFISVLYESFYPLVVPPLQSSIHHFHVQWRNWNKWPPNILQYNAASYVVLHLCELFKEVIDGRDYRRYNCQPSTSSGIMYTLYFANL